MTERYRAYDVFARMYDRHWGKHSAGHLDLLDSHVLESLPPNARVLDLCCGTGQLARILSDRGYEVTGIDGSEAMIAYAQQNAPEVSFLVDDARTFDCGRVFDAVLCMYDSLNHVMSEEELTSVFQRVASALREGGVFALDLNMEPKYLHTWTTEFSVVEAHEACIVRTGVELEKRRASFDATLFYEEENGHWSRHEVRLEQTWYGMETVLAALAASGFGPPATYVKQTMPDNPETALNLLFVTRRLPAG